MIKTEEDRIMACESFMGKYTNSRIKNWLIANGFFKAPASTKYHGAYEGGLFDHSYTVAKTLVELTKNNNLAWCAERSPYIVGMFHDLCKIDQYVHPVSGTHINGEIAPDTTKWKFSTNTYLTGHGDKSVMLLSHLFSLTEEEILCIRYHMGAFTEKEEWNYYTKAIHKYPTVLWTHHADMIASHVLNY